MKKRKISIEHLQNAADDLGGLCLSTTYNGVKFKYKWQCLCDHIWEATAINVIYNQHWCPKCGGTARRSIDDLRYMATINGGNCLSKQYLNNKYKYEWECAFGHIWLAKYNDIQQGHWCPYCAGTAKKDITYLIDMAIKHNGKCLSATYINCDTKYLWLCCNGHQWEATARMVGYEHWCPVCNFNSSKIEQLIFKTIKTYFDDAENKKMGLLRNKKFELDIFIPSIQKAIEVDGAYWHDRPERKESDIRKNKECKKAGIKLLRIRIEPRYDINKIFKKISKFLGRDIIL